MKFMVEVRFVSVVVPTYNRKEMLKDCLTSLFNQTYPKDKYEIIVVNDGSTDGTEEVLNEYAKKAPCIFKWFSQENKGPSAARNLGIEHAKGEIICFTDDDCIADERWIENLVKEFTNEKVGGVGGEIVAYNPKTLTEKYGNRFNQRERAKEYLLTGNAAYRKDVLDAIGGFDENLRSLEDVDLGIRVKAKGYELRYTPHAIVFHKHYDTLQWLMRRQYFLGKMFARLSRKYIHHFSVKYYLIRWLISLLGTMATLPACIFKQNRKEHILYEFFSIIIVSSAIVGLIVGSMTERYPGRKVSEKLDFLENESIIQIVKRVLRRI